MGIHIRRNELALLRSKLDQRLNTAVTGASGIGKTALLNHLASQTDADVVRVPCSSSDAVMPLSGVWLLVAALRVLEDDQLISQLETLAEAEQPFQQSVDAALELIRSTRLNRELLVLIDGIDLLDEQSQKVIGHIMRRMTHANVRIVATARSITPGSSLEGIPVVELAPLSRAATVEMAAVMTTEALCADAATAAAMASGGNPRALKHILAAMTDRQRRGDAPFAFPLLADVTDSPELMRDVEGVSDDGLEALRTLALAPLTPILTLQRRYAHVWEEILDLLARGIIEREDGYLRLGNTLLRSALHWGMTSAQRSVLRGEVVVTGAPDNGSMIRWHRSFTELAEDTAQELLDDARQLVEASHVDAGIRFAERALTLAMDPALLAHGLVRLAEALDKRGEFVFSGRYVRFARQSDETVIQLRAARLTIKADFFRTGGLQTGIRHLWGPAEQAEAPNEVAALQTVLAMAHAERFELSEAHELLTAASENDAALSQRTRELVESAWVTLDGFRGRGEKALALYRMLQNPNRSPQPAYTAVAAVRALTYTEHYAEAREILELLNHRLPSWSMWCPLLPFMQADLEIRTGNLHRVASLLDRAVRARFPGQPMREDQRLLLECWVLYSRNRTSDADEVEQELVRQASATGNRGALAMLNYLQGSHLLAEGLAAEAVRHLQRCDELSPGNIDPIIIRHEPELIEALIQVGRREHASLVLQRFRTRLTRFPSRWGELSAQRCEALLATGEESLEMFRRALRGWRPTDSEHDKARMLAAYARRLDDLGARAQSEDPLLSALALFERTGDQVRVRTHTPVRVPDAPRRPTHPLLSQLSYEEQAVVDLVREGCRNREIADRVFVSLRTVEIRLTSIYRRFGVRSRTELVAKILAAEETVPG